MTLAKTFGLKKPKPESKTCQLCGEEFTLKNWTLIKYVLNPVLQQQKWDDTHYCSMECAAEHAYQKAKGE